ncbi:MAG: type II toxin-antitoxin system Phd/YefM family antitoxin [Gemmatimonadales bacterium]
MRSVGVRELKAHLSRILRQVQAGESILVTDRGRVVAELRQPGAEVLAESPVERAIRAMAAAGALRLAEPTPEPYAASPIKSKPGTARELLDQDRSER